MLTMSSLNPINPLFSSYIFYSTLLLVKLLAMSLLTTTFRVRRGIFASPEDVECFGGTATRNDLIERIRRGHRNDLENIIPFLILALFYTLSTDNEGTAVLCFRIFTAARFLHTFFYIVTQRQPWRFFAFVVGMIVNLYMATQILF